MSGSPDSNVPSERSSNARSRHWVRFHGRDPKAWEKTVSERFRYLYKEAELQEWVPRIEHLAEGAREVHSLMNNCCSDYAVVNARQFDALLRGQDPDSAAQQLRLQARQAEG
jgi:uncharacterized protein YecE (DUF72 family)